MKQSRLKKNKTEDMVVKTFKYAPLLICGMIIAGCNNSKKSAPVIEVLPNDSTVADTTVYGRCGDGTAMHTLELITDKNDTIVYTLEGLDTCTNVQGGLFVGDRLAVIGTRVEGLNEEMFAEKVINLTSLIGVWSSLDKRFEIREGGAVVSNTGEPKPYTEWKILNGRLILTPDTFDIYELGPDSLFLENDKGIYGYKRKHVVNINDVKSVK